MQVSTLGIDLAKNVFQLHGIDNSGKTVLRRKSVPLRTKTPGAFLNSVYAGP
ncbi:hypothetical protein RF240_19280 [Dickeya dadantii]|uniref:hypothetical protein n=1 Tax=Dickeya dadantii TaxID=204038 RepID=UPI0035A86205